MPSWTFGPNFPASRLGDVLPPRAPRKPTRAQMGHALGSCRCLECAELRRERGMLPLLVEIGRSHCPALRDDFDERR